MDNILEEQRALHEERDRIETAIVNEMLNKKTGQREKLASEHTQKHLIDKYMKCSKTLLSYYEQQFKRPLKEDIDPEPFDKFYLRFKKIKDIYEGRVSEPLVDWTYEAPPNPEFTDEESHGKFLDLVKCHQTYLQVHKGDDRKPNYLDFLKNLDKVSDLSKNRRMRGPYRIYLDEILDYFRNYCKRSKPLFDIEEMEKEIESIVNESGNEYSTNHAKMIDIKEKTLIKFVEIFSDTIQSTLENVQRRQARTAEEREEESDDDISDIEEEDNQTDVIYNPKNLPLSWDGKPIPYWLYKLHGLNMSFTCEICGNAVYKGPKAFQRHFTELRHAQGLKALDIPSTSHFANITKIDEALRLWEKLKNERLKDEFKNEYEEEYEDSLGNVVNKKTYEDLKRQGLL